MKSITLPELPELKFNEEKHLYTLEQSEIVLELPSVTQILRFVSREIYNDIPQYILDQAADKGTRVHEAIEFYEKYGWLEGDDEIKPYLLAYEAWVKENKFLTVATEYSVYHSSRYYAGRIDKLALDDKDNLCLIDIKTSETVLKALTAAQLYGYAEALKSHGINIVNHYILHLKQDASYDFIKMDIQKGFRIFEACAFLHGELKKGE